MPPQLDFEGVLRPGRILTWRALTNSSSKPVSSSTYQTGFQYWPVASITTCVTWTSPGWPDTVAMRPGLILVGGRVGAVVPIR
jgi:hypothetical protein